ncbi:restriction endonuclease subunit S [Fusobacterium ulcerans]|uniref:restriction endonuclease subunit S n=1 Tax=Fusobacterium ulcerans TaxID=861 RepID=UPI001032C7DB|nr:restriction endonuclease subunit S [Fusobacterium ulcerans]
MAKNKELTLEEKLREALIPKEELPYEIPESWEWVKLGNVSEINPKKKVLNIDENEKISFLPMKSISDVTGRILNIEYESYSKLKKGYTQFLENDILFAKITPCMENGKCAIAKNLKNGIGYGTTEFHVLRTTYALNNKFLYNFLRQERFRQEAKYNMTGSVGFRRVPVEFLKRYIFPLPPLEEQKRIVEKLDSMFEKINKAKELIQEVKENIENRKESILNKAFRGELTAEWRKNNQTEDAIELLKSINEEKIKNWEQACIEAEKSGKKKPSKPKIEEIENIIISKEEEPYEIPKNWKWVRLENVTSKITDGTHKTPTYIDDGVPFISVKNIKNNKIYFDDIKYISQEEHKELYKRCNPEKGDILITKSGTIGRTAEVKEEFEFSLFVSVALIKNYKNIILSKYLLYNTNDYMNKINIASDIKGGVIKNYHISDIKKQPIPLPPLKEQEEIVRILDEILEKESKIKELIELEEAIELLEKSILDKAFRGELGTQNKEDEPAIELLKKIL